MPTALRAEFAAMLKKLSSGAIKLPASKSHPGYR